MKNIDAQVKTLAIKYFIEQKSKEIGKFVLILLIIIISALVIWKIPLWLGQWNPLHIPVQPENITFDVFWDLGFLYSVMLVVAGLFIFMITNWLLANWKRAVERAKREVKK